MRENGDKKPVSKGSHKHKHSHYHDVASLSGCDEAPAKPTTFLQRLLLFAVLSIMHVFLYCNADRLPFPFWVIQIMVGCYLLGALFCTFFPFAANLAAPLVCILFYLSVFSPFVFVCFFAEQMPEVVAFVMSGLFSVPIILFSQRLVRRMIKIIRGVDVLAEDRRLEEESRKKGAQLMARLVDDPRFDPNKKHHH